MEEAWQFPCCWSAVDGCRIPIKCPPGGLESCKEYHNFKNFFSMVLMGMVDSKYRFFIFQSTDLWNQIKNQDYLPKVGKKVGSLLVPPLILGDAAFPLQPWLMKPCTNANPTLQQRYYNYRLSRARMVTEGAFGQLKGRWRVLLRRCECSQENTKKAALACVVLHNICLEKEDTITREMDLAIDPKTGNRRDRAKIRELLQMRACASCSLDRQCSFFAFAYAFLKLRAHLGGRYSPCPPALLFNSLSTFS